MTTTFTTTPNAYDVRIECDICHESKSGSLARAWAGSHTHDAAATFPRVCGCGETQGVTTVVMTDKLWTEFFAVEGAERPKYAAACRVCIPDWHRYAGPLKLASTTACRFCGIETHIHAKTPVTVWAGSDGSLGCEESTHRVFTYIGGGTVGRHLPIGR